MYCFVNSFSNLYYLPNISIKKKKNASQQK